MKFLILGDVHGKWYEMSFTIAKAIRANHDITHIIQMGDLGYGWPGGKPFEADPRLFDEVEMDIYEQATKLWLDGNHENFDQLEMDGGAWLPKWTYMPRGSVLECPTEYGDVKRMLFFGGATSIDKDMRIPHRSWWPQESIQYGQIIRTLESVHDPIHAVFSHEHPAAVPYSDVRYTGRPFGKSDKYMLEMLKLKYNPEFWFFGHHHHGDTGIVDGTEWYCCPIIEDLTYTIWDGERVTKTW